MSRAIISKGIEMPRKNRAKVTSFGTEINLSETLDALEIGDSFVLDTHKMRNYALTMANRKGMQLTSEKQGTGKIRLWRAK